MQMPGKGKPKATKGINAEKLPCFFVICFRLGAIAEKSDWQKTSWPCPSHVIWGMETKGRRNGLNQNPLALHSGRFLEGSRRVPIAFLKIGLGPQNSPSKQKTNLKKEEEKIKRRGWNPGALHLAFTWLTLEGEQRFENFSS